MSDEKRRSPYADIAPALAEYTDNVLFGDVWKRPELAPRDRSLVTVASLVSLYRTNELPFHLAKALEECQFTATVSEDLVAYSAKQRRQFIAGLTPGDAQNAKRIAAFDAHVGKTRA